MILDLLIGMLLVVVRGLLGVFPVWTPPVEFLGGDLIASSGLASALGHVSYFVPIGFLGACLLAIILLELAFLAFNVAVYIYKLIPLKAT